jgi:pullulanase/glycogen debranching enzyme
VWLNAEGQPMTISDWHDASQHSFACQMSPATPGEQSLLIIFNPQPDAVTMTLPAGNWHLLFDSADELVGSRASFESVITVPARSLVALRSSV